MIYVLLIYTCILTLISFVASHKDITSPSFLFCGAFTFAIAWAAAFAKSWGFAMHLNTFLVIAGGMTEFVIVSVIVQLWMKKIRDDKTIKKCKELTYIEVETWKKWAVLIIEVVASAATVIGIVRIMSTNLTQAMTAIAEYRSLSMFSDETMQALPTWINLLRSVVLALGYWFLYVFINNFILKKWDFLTLAIVLIAATTSMTTGGRGDAFFMVISAIVMYLLLKKKQTGFRKSIKIKTFLIIFLALVAVFASSQGLANLVGREGEESLIEYLAIYCGAQIMNLDTYLQGSIRPTNIWGGQTFIGALPWLAPIFGLDIEHYALDLPFQKANGINLGNVYTTFYPFVYDFGYIGVFVMTALMAIISQWIYERAKRVAFKKTATFSVILYGYISASIFFSFFSNKFYEQVCNIWFIRNIIIWWLSNVLFCRTHMHFGKDSRRTELEAMANSEKV